MFRSPLFSRDREAQGKIREQVDARIGPATFVQQCSESLLTCFRRMFRPVLHDVGKLPGIRSAENGLDCSV
jgi:hypothetical protein